MTAHNNNPSDRDLWKRIAHGPAPGPEPANCPDPMDLAAWIDGRLTDEAHVAIDAHLAHCPECLAHLRATRALLDDNATAEARVPAHVVLAAKTLVTETQRTEAPASVAVATGTRWRLQEWLGRGRWGLAAAASIAVCFLGYRAGSVAVGSDADPSGELLDAMMFNVLETSLDDDALDIEFLASALQEAQR